MVTPLTGTGSRLVPLTEYGFPRTPSLSDDRVRDTPAPTGAPSPSRNL